MLSRILLSPPDIGKEEEQAAIRVLRSGWVAPSGPELECFEKDLSEYIGVEHSVVLSSGTAGLHLGLLAIGVKPQDFVITSTLTFVATANAILYVGAVPFFVDCLPDGTIDPELVHEAVAGLLAQGESVGAIVPVDLYGKASDYTTLREVANSFGIPILSDSAEALGSEYKGVKVGAIGVPTVFSFNGNKIMTTGGGGLLVSSDKQLVDRVRYLSTQAREPVAHYEHAELGFNYRLSSVSAAIGRAQLSRLSSMIASRREIRSRYRALLSPFDNVSLLSQYDDGENCWLTAVVFRGEQSEDFSSRLLESLDEKRIEARRVWKPMHLQPLYSGASFLGGRVAESLFSNGIVLPSGSSMLESEFERIETCLLNFLRA